MTPISTNGKNLYIARHGETVFNKAGRLQGDHTHTPLTRTGFAQADEMGAACAKLLGSDAKIKLVASDTGRALQTLAVIAEHVRANWHDTATDARLREIGMGSWGGKYYRDLEGQLEIDRERMLFATRAPGGEGYDDVAKRLESWLAEQNFTHDAIIISHGMTSRVLRGILTGAGVDEIYGAPIASGLPQGSVVQICDGVETLIHRGGGEGEKA